MRRRCLRLLDCARVRFVRAGPFRRRGCPRQAMPICDACSPCRQWLRSAAIPTLKAFADQLRRAGKRGKQIIVAVMRRLLILAYGTLKSGRRFDTPGHSVAGVGNVKRAFAVDADPSRAVDILAYRSDRLGIIRTSIVNGQRSFVQGGVGHEEQRTGGFVCWAAEAGFSIGEVSAPDRIRCWSVGCCPPIESAQVLERSRAASRDASAPRPRTTSEQ